MPLSVTWVACYTQKNVPWHILAPSTVACDIFHLRASAHLRHVSASFCNMEPMLQKERGQETCNASFLTPLSAYILCTTLFFMQCSLPYLFSFVKRFFNLFFQFPCSFPQADFMRRGSPQPRRLHAPTASDTFCPSRSLQSARSRESQALQPRAQAVRTADRDSAEPTRSPPVRLL